MKTYNVLSTIKDADGIHLPGSTVGLEDAHAKELLELGSIGRQPEPAVQPSREQLILAAILNLDQANDDVWLKDGKPDAAAIAELTGWPVTATERDAAWATIQTPRGA